MQWTQPCNEHNLEAEGNCKKWTALYVDPRFIYILSLAPINVNN